eukprot:1197461-Amphidinium_carterae.2
MSPLLCAQQLCMICPRANGRTLATPHNVPSHMHTSHLTNTPSTLHDVSAAIFAQYVRYDQTH